MSGFGAIGELPIGAVPAASSSTGPTVVQSGTLVTTTTRKASDTITIAGSTSGNALFVWGTYNPSGGVTLAITDDKSNTWNIDASANLNTNTYRTAFVASCLAPATGTTAITLTYSGGTAVVTAAWAEYSGIAGLDNAASHGSGGNGQSTPQTLTASAVDTTANDLVLHAFTNGGSFSSNQGYTPPASTSGGAFTNAVVQQQNNGTFGNGYADYRINTSTLTNDATDSWVTGADFIAQALVSYKGAGSSPDVTVALAGQSVTVSTGTIAPSASIPLSGQGVTASTGTLGVNHSQALTGTAVTASAGTLTPSSSIAVTGQAVTASTGTLGVQSSVTLTGQAVTASAGTITPSIGGDLTLALTGIDLVFATGTITASAPAATQQYSGGYGVAFALEQRALRYRWEREKAKRLAEEAQEQQEKVDAEIARLMHAELARQAELAELQRLRLLVARNAQIEGVNESVQMAFDRARAEQSFSRLQALQRELNKALEDEEMAVLMALMGVD